MSKFVYGIQKPQILQKIITFSYVFDLSISPMTYLYLHVEKGQGHVVLL